jgi:hypothetical protein
MPEENKIRDAADAIKGALEVVPIYQDALQPMAKEVGIALQTVAKTLHILLAPVSSLVWSYGTIKDFVVARVAEKLKDVPTERLQSPEPYIACPVIEALRYTGYQETLRDLYANLLATSIDSKTAHTAHPSFVEIIKQMSPDEALIMRSLAAAPIRPFIDVRKEEKDSHLGTWALKHFSLIPRQASAKCPDLESSYLVNLERLGLIQLRENYTLKSGDQDIYQALREAPEIQKLVTEINRIDGHKAQINTGAIIATDLGHQFFRACIYEGMHKEQG